MSAYVIYLRDRIVDPEELRKYEEAAPSASVGHAVTPLAYYGEVETLEGPRVDGAAVIEFPSLAEARAAYEDPRYQEAMKHRLKGAEYRVFVVDGISPST
jgi:uncharacterized protein (DUF1330 family)